MGSLTQNVLFTAVLADSLLKQESTKDTKKISSNHNDELVTGNYTIECQHPLLNQIQPNMLLEKAKVLVDFHPLQTTKTK